MLSVILTLQIISGLCWAVVLCVLIARGVWLVRGQGNENDVRALPMLIISLAEVSRTARWWFFPGVMQEMDETELVYWAIIYAMTAFGALTFLALWRRLGV